MTTALAIPDTGVMEKDTPLVVQQANAIVVDSDETWEEAGEFLVIVKTKRKEVAGAFDDIISNWNVGHKAAIAKKNEFDGPLKKAETSVKLQMGIYTTERAAKARREQQQREAEARRVEEDRRLAEAEQLEKENRKQEAEQLLEAPIVVAVAPAPPPPKVKGVSTSIGYDWELVDLALIPEAYKSLDRVKINGVVRAHHEAAEKMIPGIRVTSHKAVAATGL